MKSLLKHSWKFIGILLLAYVFSMIILVPMGPGLEGAEVVLKEDGELVLKVDGFATHFAADVTDEADANKPTRAFLKEFGSEGRFIEAKSITIKSSQALVIKWNLPDTLPVKSWGLVINTPIDGTLWIPNVLFHEPVIHAEPSSSSLLWTDINNADLHEQQLSFHFPYQPRIVESIRNLMLHVPMWFTMFLLMGIGVYNSITSLARYGGQNQLRKDIRAEAAVKVGLLFGILGLITGSLWARFTWGAWWVDDPQLNGAMVTVLVYLGYMTLRTTIKDDELRKKMSAVYNIFAFVILIVLLMILPKYTESLHPGKGDNPAFSKYDLDSALRLAFYPAVIGWMLLGTWMYLLSVRLERVRRKIRTKLEY